MKTKGTKEQSGGEKDLDQWITHWQNENKEWQRLKKEMDNGEGTREKHFLIKTHDSKFAEEDGTIAEQT